MPRKRKSAMPVSKATNAYELLEEIRQIILEEPLRYDQGDVLTFISDGERENCKAPDCGTIGCVGGWVVALKTRPSRLLAVSLQCGNLTKARRILGLTFHQADRLFYGGPINSVVPQTARHARAGAAHIARFMKAHAEQLKAKKV